MHHKQYEILNAQCIFVAGGNAFKLMRELEKHDLADSIHRAVFSGVPYIGCSSGVVVANPSLSKRAYKKGLNNSKAIFFGNPH